MIHTRLGRVLEHDPRSKSYPARVGPLRSVTYRRYGRVLDQGNVGSCTGNAMAQQLNTVPVRKRGTYVNEAEALGLYSLATQLDEFDGTYPPTDSGSSGLAVSKAAVQRGYLTSYTHGFGFDHILGGLMTGPAIVGTNWHEDMFNPDSKGFVHPTGAVAGGHEYLLFGVNMVKRYLVFLNSWSDQWGIKGRFFMGFEDFTTLINADGDATFGVR